MKKSVKILSAVLCLILGVCGFTACGGEKEILVVSREAGSGTRDAFDGMIKNAAGDSLAKKADGTNQPSSIFVESMNVQDGTAKVLTKVSAAESAIGYISLGSLNSSVKALKVGEVAPGAETVLNGSYKLQRPFVIMTKKDKALNAAAQDFLKYLGSSTAQDKIAAEGFVKQTNASQTPYTQPSSVLSGTVKLRGSTSVEPLMNKLFADYKAKGGANVSGITFDTDEQGSSAGITAAKGDNDGNIIGMSSSALKTADSDVLDNFNICLDAIAIIVHKNNSIGNLTIAQIFDIYTGKIVKFSEIQ